LRAAEIIQQRFVLNKVLFIPSYIPPHKDSVGIASPSHRLKMVKLALRSHSNFLASSVEIEAKGRSYSIITINKIKKIYPDALIFFILGVDAFLEIDTWKDYSQVLQKCFFIVINRPPYQLDEAKNVLDGRLRDRMYEMSHKEELREKMLCSSRIFLLPFAAMDVSSTEIRERIKGGGLINGMVPEEIDAYIRKNKLYLD
jgi:nicotinate-nucleotide adenylyltransferase